jgi:ankyrin repeat protein
MKAIQRDRPDLAAVVLEKAGRINIKDDRGATALHLAAARGQVALMAQLLDRGADLKAKMKEGSTPLGEAAYMGQAEAIQLLVDRGSGVNDQSSDYYEERNWTPLMRAVSRGHEKAVEVLLKCKADVHYRNAQQQSALSLARERKAGEIEKMLLDAGAKR